MFQHEGNFGGVKNELLKIRRSVYEMFGLKTHPLIIQIELAGKCTANCEFCDWTRRLKSQQIFMDTASAKKAVKEAREMKADIITFHVTGESLDHPDLFDIMPDDYPVGLSTNCLSLKGDTAERISKMKHMNLTLAIPWAETDSKREAGIYNAERFLEMNPVCNTICIQMICSETSIKHSVEMYGRFLKYMDKLPNVSMFYKQPYAQEVEHPTLGYIPTALPNDPRVKIDTMPTPQSCGADCLAIAPNPMTSILIQVDGQIKPCFYRPEDPLKANHVPPEYRNGWKMGNIKDMSLQEFWASEKLKYMRKIWAAGDPEGKLPCYNCIRMVAPREPVWWNTTGIVPTELDEHQAKKGDPFDPYVKPR
jgi:MoaA/NifB/PqqE/SkfB family radical SAM enzyme